MAQLQLKSKNPMTFTRLMRLGQVAHTQGDHRSAFEYWSQAAILQPEDEQVWTALMWVLERDEDRKVCLRNLLAINPNNIQARDMLDDLIGETQPQTDNLITPEPEPKQRIDILRVLVLGAIYGIGSSISIVLLQILLS